MSKKKKKPTLAEIYEAQVKKLAKAKLGKQPEFPIPIPKEIKEIEEKFEEKVGEVAEWLSEEVGEPVEKIAGHIRDAFEEHLPKLTKIQKLKLKADFHRLVTPVVGPFLAFSWTGGQPNPIAIPILALGGAWFGWVEAREVEKEIHKLEEKERKKLKKVI